MVISSSSGHRITGSKLHRSFSKANLEKRLGPFQSKPEWCTGVKPEKTYLREPNSQPNPLRDEYEKLREARESEKKKRLEVIDLNYTRKKEYILAENAVDKAQARSIRTGRHEKRRLYTAIHRKFRGQLDTLHADTKQAKKEVYAECCRQTWVQWLQEQARAGRTEALKALRKRAFSLAKKNGAALRGENSAEPGAELGAMPGQKVDGVTKHGTIIYDLGADTVRDDGDSFRISSGASPDTDIMALRLAQRRFGNTITVDGDHAFRSRMIRAAVEGKVFITFADPVMERQRNAIVCARCQDMKERENEERRRTEHEPEIGKMGSPFRPSFEDRTYGPIRRDEHTADGQLENDPKHERPGGRGVSR